MLVIQPSERDAPAMLGEWLAAAGAELNLVRPAHSRMPEDLDAYRAVVCLGGAMSANAVLEYPWLSDVQRVLARAVAARIPVLGVCLGAQLLAVACGGRVAPGSEGPEVGPALVAKRDAAWTDPLFAELPLLPDVLQFHRDVVERLPSAAVVLASSNPYPNQAYRIGDSAYGLQFHIETTTDIVLDWAARAPDVASVASEGDLSRERLDELHTDMAETWRPFAQRFVRLAAGDLEPAEPARTNLPLA